MAWGAPRGRFRSGRSTALAAALATAGVLLTAGMTLPAQAEIAVLRNGTTFKISSSRVVGESVMLALKDGGEVGVPAEALQGFVPDEVLEELAAAVAEIPAAGADDLHRLAAEAARRHGLAPELVRAVVKVESAFRPDAVSPKGARGLMQLMPGTAAELGVVDVFDPRQNLDGGARHLRTLVDRYNGDLRLALAAYNAGAGAVARHGGVPPYRETRDYVERVLRQLPRQTP